MIDWLRDNWAAALGYWFLASCIAAAIIGRIGAIAKHGPVYLDQHPLRNSAEGANGVGVDKIHNRSTSL